MDSSKDLTEKLAHWLRPRHRKATLGILLMMGLLTSLHFSNFRQEIECSDLLDGEPCRPSQTQEIVRALKIEGLVDYELVEGRIMVPNPAKTSYYAALEKHGIPGFGGRQDDALKSNFLLSPSERERIAKLRKRREVIDMIVRLPYVDEAWLECDSCSDALFEPVRMSAVVVVQPRQEQILSWDNISTIRETIAGAFAGLSPEDIVLTDLNEGRAHPEASAQGNVQAQSARWRVDRQRFYIEKIKRILAEYTDIEIDVHVEQAGEFRGTDQLTRATRLPLAVEGTATSIGVAHRIPARDENTTALSVQQADSLSPGANGSAVVRPLRSTTQWVGYVDGSDVTNKGSETVDTPAAVNVEKENVHVIIRIPATSLGCMPCPIDSANIKVASVDTKFKLIREDIIKRISPVLPNGLDQGEAPVAVILEGDSPGEPLAGLSWNWLKQSGERHWPLLAVGVLGFMCVLFNAWAPSESTSTAETGPAASPYEAAEGEELKIKLASLIDQDPETAAKVIKSWLRDIA
ncbi:MAG: hypothetical protein VYE64_08360 [Planctomycetota bacterium]|nr:hypothetical protein [Planctomycetota bacterium]